MSISKSKLKALLECDLQAHIFILLDNKFNSMLFVFKIPKPQNKEHAKHVQAQLLLLHKLGCNIKLTFQDC